MELVVVGFVGWLVFREWKEGRLTLPLRGHDFLVGDLTDFVLANRMVPRTIMTEAERSAGMIYPYEFEDHLEAKLQEHLFPPARVHDLRKALITNLKKHSEWYAPEQGSYVKGAFDAVAERHEARRRQWTK